MIEDLFLSHLDFYNSEGSYKLEDTLSLLLLIQVPSCVRIVPAIHIIDKHPKLNYIVSF